MCLGKSEEGINPPGTGVKVIVSPCGVGNPTWVLYKINKGSHLMIHLSSPYFRVKVLLYYTNP